MTQRAAVNETLLKAFIMAEDKSGNMSERGDRRGERHCDDRGVETGGRVVADQSVIYPVDSAPLYTLRFSLDYRQVHVAYNYSASTDFILSLLCDVYYWFRT